MLKQPIYYEFNLDARTSPSKLIAISHVDDKYSEVLEVAVKQNDRFVYMGGATVVARMVLHRDKDYLLSDDVACSVNDNGNILIPFDNAVVKTSHGVVKIEVNITRDTDELTLQFPLWVSVNGSILDNAEVTPESEGTIPDLLKEAADALEDAKEALEASGDYDNLNNKPQINGVTLSGDKTSDVLGVAGWKIAAIDNCIEDGVLYSTQINDQAAYVLARNITTDITQYAFCRDGRVMWRTRQAETQWQPAGEWSEWEEIGGSYNNLEDKPQINGVTLSGNKTSDVLGVAGWKIAAIDNCIEDGVLYSTQINDQAAYVLARNITTDITQYAFCRDGRVMWRTRQAETQWQPAGEWSEWEEIGLKIASGVINQNGTISFYDADGNLLFTTTGASVIGPQGAPGNDYVLTAQDKADIADIVLQELPTTQGVLYGNTSN